MNMPLPPEPPGDLAPRGRWGAWVAARRRLAHTARHPLFWVGAREMSGVSVGLTAWAFMTGVAMVKSGMSMTESVLMSLLVFAGSAQLAAIPLIAAGAPLWVIWPRPSASTCDFVVFSLHLRQYFMFLPRARRLRWATSRAT
jgi:predicted branched-subunit amino acid permease